MTKKRDLENAFFLKEESSQDSSSQDSGTSATSEGAISLASEQQSDKENFRPRPVTPPIIKPADIFIPETPPRKKTIVVPETPRDKMPREKNKDEEDEKHEQAEDIKEDEDLDDPITTKDFKTAAEDWDEINLLFKIVNEGQYQEAMRRFLLMHPARVSFNPSPWFIKFSEKLSNKLSIDRLESWQHTIAQEIAWRHPAYSENYHANQALLYASNKNYNLASIEVLNALWQAVLQSSQEKNLEMKTRIEQYAHDFILTTQSTVKFYSEPLFKFAQLVYEQCLQRPDIAQGDADQLRREIAQLYYHRIDIEADGPRNIKVLTSAVKFYMEAATLLMEIAPERKTIEDWDKFHNSLMRGISVYQQLSSQGTLENIFAQHPKTAPVLVENWIRGVQAYIEILKQEQEPESKLQHARETMGFLMQQRMQTRLSELSEIITRGGDGLDKAYKLLKVTESPRKSTSSSSSLSTKMKLKMGGK